MQVRSAFKKHCSYVLTGQIWHEMAQLCWASSLTCSLCTLIDDEGDYLKVLAKSFASSIRVLGQLFTY